MIGLFLGDTNFPNLILKKIKKKKIDFFIIDLSFKNKFKKEKNSHRISIGKFGAIIKIINYYKCKNVLFAGKINKPSLTTLRLDLKGAYYFPKIISASKKGDAAIFKVIIEILKKEKIKVIPSNFFNPELTLKKGSYTKIRPNINDIATIKKGINFLNKTNNLDHVQAVAVKDNDILAYEDIYGTKKMLSKLKKNSNAILIKLPKNKQDLRIDLPTIGLQTLIDCKKYGLRGLVLRSNKNIFLDKSKVIKFANKNNIFIEIL